MSEKLEQIVIIRLSTGEIKITEMGEGITHHSTKATDPKEALQLVSILMTRLYPATNAL